MTIEYQASPYIHEDITFSFDALEKSYQSKYEALLKAVMALDPFNQIFYEWDGDCMGCEKPRIAGLIDHTPECPVTNLRELLEGVSHD